MSWVLNVWLWLLILPSLLIIIIPLIDRFFNTSFIEYIDQIMWWLGTLIWSNNVNYMFQILAIIMFFFVFRWIIRSISNFK